MASRLRATELDRNEARGALELRTESLSDITRVQLFDEEFASKFEFDVLDATKIIPEKVVPIRRVGRPVLENLPPSPALSIVRTGPDIFKGRKVGALVTGGVDAGLLAALEQPSRPRERWRDSWPPRLAA